MFIQGLVGFGDYDFKKTIARGAIYLMDPTKGYTHVEQLTIEGWSEKEHFEPHGVHHWVHENSKLYGFTTTTQMQSCTTTYYYLVQL